MKIIPKDTKVKNYIWKKFTILDAMIGAVLIFAVIGIFASSNKYKFIIGIAVFIPGFCLFLPVNNRLLYKELIQAVKYLFYKKEYMGKEVDRLIPFTGIDEDGYIVYPGYYGKVLKIGSKDFSLLDEFMQDGDIEAFARAINSIDMSDVIDIVKIDKAIILDEYLEKLKNMIEAEEDEKRKAVLYSKLSDIDILNDADKPIYEPGYYTVFYGTRKEDIDIVISNFIENFSETGLRTKTLGKTETAIFLKHNFTRDFDEREAYELSDEELISWIKPEYIKFSSNSLTVNNNYGLTVAVEDYPIEVGAAFLGGAFNIDGIRAVMHISGVDQDRGVRRIDRAINEVLSRREGLQKASDEIENEAHVDTMQELLIALKTENERFFDVTVTFTAFNYDNLNKKVFRKRVLALLKNNSLNINTLHTRQVEGYINSNISRKTALKIYERGINSTSLAASFPFVSSKIMDKDGMYLGANSNGFPVMLDILKRDEKHNNSNAFVVGTSGSGKSYFLKVLLSHLYSTGSKVYILDPENEYSMLCKNFGGGMIDIGKGDKGRINPFHIYSGISDDDKNEVQENKATFNAHLRTLESFFRVVLPKITDEALEYLNNAIIETYSIKGIGESTDISELEPNDFPIFDDLIKYLNKEYEINKENLYKRNILSTVITYVSKFGTGGRYSDLWNGETTLKTDKDFTVFNFQSLFAAKNDIVANAQMLLIFRYLEERLIIEKDLNEKTEKNGHTIIVVDEAHLFIDKKYPIALDFMYQMTKRIRKYGGAFIPATQSISDWNATEELRNKTSAILRNSQYSFIFKLKGNDIEDLVDLYKSSSPINEIERNHIARASRGNCFFIESEDKREMFMVDANETIKEFFESEVDIEESGEVEENEENE